MTFIRGGGKYNHIVSKEPKLAMFLGIGIPRTMPMSVSDLSVSMSMSVSMGASVSMSVSMSMSMSVSVSMSVSMSISMSVSMSVSVSVHCPRQPGRKAALGLQDV